MRSAVVVSFASVAAARYVCPSGPWVPHAGLRMTSTAAVDCETVKAEMRSRVAGENGWYDQHNHGTYTEQNYGGDLSYSRVTGNGKYTDKMVFVFTDVDGSCKIEGCSKSQVFSILDFSTNYCEQKLLYCGSDEGCNVANYDFTHTEDKKRRMAGATTKFSNCLKVQEASSPLLTSDQVSSPPQQSSFITSASHEFSGSCLAVSNEVEWPHGYKMIVSECHKKEEQAPLWRLQDGRLTLAGEDKTCAEVVEFRSSNPSTAFHAQLVRCDNTTTSQYGCCNDVTGPWSFSSSGELIYDVASSPVAPHCLTAMSNSGAYGESSIVRGNHCDGSLSQKWSFAPAKSEWETV
jgi:hypothetical protein